MSRAVRLNRPPVIRLLDDAACRCRNIAALAALLEVCAQNTETVTIAPECLGHAGGMIFKDVQHLRELLEQIQYELARRHRRN